jgi:hypothetical protein
MHIDPGARALRTPSAKRRPSVPTLSIQTSAGHPAESAPARAAQGVLGFDTPVDRAGDPAPAQAGKRRRRSPA